MSSPQTAIPFGNYLLIKRLAVGGMAELFLSQRPPDPELVVLKRILPYLSEEPEFVQMFLDEARIAAQLHHPNIVQVHELGKEGDNIFIAMEYVEGVDLRRVMAEESKFGATVPYGVAARICAQVAAGLDYAHHSRGVDGRPLELIHRDVSPQNVMIGYDGRVKLVDFGIAKAGAFMERSKPGVIKGKFLYLAPEQVSQERLDHRADIFALGTMLYEITTGRQPFAKPTTEGILYAIRYEDPSPPHLLRDDYPQALSRIVMRCLTKDRTLRYQRASEVSEALEAFLVSGAIRQSLDVSEYICRLLGEEEERTILHIPEAKGPGRREATVPLPGARLTQDAAPPKRPSVLESTAPTLSSTTPESDLTPVPGAQLTPGLSARPTPRRASRDSVPAFSIDEAEPDTQMARPRELPARRQDDDEDSEMSTAVGTTPAGYRMAALVVEELDIGDGESTVPQRARARDVPARPSAPPPAPAPVRRSAPHMSPPPARVAEPSRSRRPGLAAPAQGLPSRRTSPPDDGAGSSAPVTPPPPRRPSSLDVEVSQSVSLTPATVNHRPPPRSSLTRGFRPDEDDEESLHTDLNASSLEYTDPRPTFRDDPDDDESTMGYGGGDSGEDTADTRATPPRRKRPVALLLACFVGALAVGVGALWFIGASRSAPAKRPRDLSERALEQQGATEPDARRVLEAPPAPKLANAPTAAQGETGTQPLVPDAPVKPPEPGVPTEENAASAPAQVSVRFSAPARTVLRREGGERLPINTLVSLPAGPIRVSYQCPGRRRPKGTKPYLIEPASEGPLVLQIPCKKRR
ncbi:serine/threonine-protein kinase [Corallococcus macrosporus]|uniref:Serine/threonine protein kinase n=1 Tax=Myxococcus fulvus (strain ATCC BAA-855 / HW-1) TaxID=483219 RepID=F8CDB4_MYXFH|nr:serine/threonine-protein kinase [Corallococcus macrosporus]AEI66031.1 serine/threonine protein kinase [Corallococcus macrosporus]